MRSRIFGATSAHHIRGAATIGRRGVGCVSRDFSIRLRFFGVSKLPILLVFDYRNCYFLMVGGPVDLGLDHPFLPVMGEIAQFRANIAGRPS